MRTKVTRFAFLLALLGPWALQPAQAQTVYVPAAVTGYTADVIANGAGTVASSTTATVDRGIPTVRWCFANTTFVNPAGISPTRALPATGFITSISTPGLTYQMAPASGNNSLRIDGVGTGTLTLTNPQPCSEVMVLATEGNGSTAPKTFTVTFTDGTTQLFTNIVVPDWFGGTITPAIIVGSRVSYVDNSVDNQSNDPRIYEVRLSLAVANYSKSVQSVTVSKTSTDPVLNVMGISLGSNCLGVPVGGTAVANLANVCPGSPVVLDLSGATVSGGITYQWQSSADGGTTYTNIAGATTVPYTIRPTATAQYRAVVTCRVQSGNSTAVPVTVLPNAAVVTYSVPGIPVTFCQSGTLPVRTATPAGGRFSTTAATGLALDATTGTINLAASAPGTYTVTYAVTTPCAATASTTLTISPPAPPFSYTCPPFYKGGPNATPAITSAAGGVFTAPAGLAVNAATGVVDLAASAVGTYTVTYATANGCTTTAPFQVLDKLIFPNVITPNGDNYNDVLRPKLANVTNYHLQVFSRWGRRVYDGRDAAQGWTAADNSPGMYYYQIEYTDCAGGNQNYKNWVEVVK
ncbi:T9SS type B sorting domain-containing protein [Hymenobacter terricola]|uniref:T9SS type B sorting domain-containing protein n=1 Tax=Hymenobacter terricola TaxID=2819236 RepID=UPI001B30336A|nr:gliding motility-associated C-terminal domain-containing protein [Hymenobacter terricola]